MNFVSAKQFALMSVLVIVSSFHLNPILPLLDQSILALLTHHKSGDYGRQRLFGSIGAGLGTLLSSEVVKHTSISSIFIIQCIASGIGLVLLCYLPNYKNETQVDMSRRSDLTTSLNSTASPTIGYLEEGSNPKSTEAAPTYRYWKSVKCIAKPDVIVLFVVVLLIGAMHGIIGNFQGLFMFNLSNENPNIIGVSATVQTISELPAFLFADKLVQRFSTSKILMVSLLAFGVRLVSYSVIPNAWWMLPIDALHGITFSLTWAACTIYAYQVSPPGTHGTMLGLLSAMSNGFGRGAGTLLGGHLYDHYGAITMWRWTALLVPVGLGFAVLFDTKAQNLDYPDEILETPNPKTPFDEARTEDLTEYCRRSTISTYA